MNNSKPEYEHTAVDVTVFTRKAYSTDETQTGYLEATAQLGDDGALSVTTPHAVHIYPKGEWTRVMVRR